MLFSQVFFILPLYFIAMADNIETPPPLSSFSLNSSKNLPQKTKANNQENKSPHQAKNKSNKTAIKLSLADQTVNSSKIHIANETKSLQEDSTENSGQNQEQLNSKLNTEESIDSYRQNLDSLSKDPVEKIKVTGSRIKRIDMEGPSPITIFSKEDLDNSGYFSVSEFLTNTSLSNFGETLIHNRSTLILVNGTRLVYNNVTDLIPQSAIERIEVLRDGASALYGSDVVGGVINIITKKDLDQLEFTIKLAPAYSGASRMDSSFVVGKSFSKWHFISAFQLQYDQGLKREQRKDWYNSYYLPYSPHASFKTEQGVIISDSCPQKLKKKNGCDHDLVPYGYLIPNSFLFSNYNYLEYDITSELSFYSQWMGIGMRKKQLKQPILDDLELPANHKMSQGVGSPGTLQYLFQDSWRDTFLSHYFLDGLIGLKGYLSKTWDFDFSLKWSNIWSYTNYKNHFYKDDITKAIVSGAYDPFNSKVRDFSSVRLYDAVYKDHDGRWFSSLDFSGEAFWDIGLAFGLQAYYNRYKNTPDPKVKAGEIFALSAVDTGVLTRNVVAGYVEAVKVFSKMWELQVAGRVDRYSDFGWTFNPKLALRFQAQENFLARASIGTSFEAPNLSDLYVPESTGYIPIYDTVACYNELKQNKHFEEINQSLSNKKEKEKDHLIREFLIEQSSVVENKELSSEIKSAFQNLADKLGEQANCRRQYFQGTTKGNKNLKETEAITASLGFLWQISEDHSLTVDYWFNHLSGSPLGSFASKKTIDAELRHGKDYVQKRGGQYERDNQDPYNKIKNPIASTINIGGKRLSGLDISWESDFPHFRLAGGHFYFEDDLSAVLTSGVETFPGMGYVNNLGKFSLPKWRNFATLGWKNQRHDFSLLLKSTASVKKAYNEFDSLPASHLLDVFYQYYMSEKTAFKFGFYNALFLDPVKDDSIKQGLKFDSNFYNLRTPHFFVELRQKI